MACIDNVTDALSGTYRILTVDGQAITQRAYGTFYPDGTYIFGIHSDDNGCGPSNGNGIEYGVYLWNQTTHAFVFVNAVIDTNGECGIANDAAPSAGGTLIKNADGTLTTDTLDTNGSGAHTIATWAPVPSTAGTLIGSWGRNNQFFNVYAADDTLFSADSRSLVQIPATSPGIEDGCYTLSGTTADGSYTVNLSATCAVSGTQTAVDATGAASGFSFFGNQAWTFSITGDTMQTTVPGAASAPTTLSRITTN